MKICFECDAPATEDHHVIPKVLGGCRTVPLCGKCHALIHGFDTSKRTLHGELTSAGLQRVRDLGREAGRPSVVGTNPELATRIVRMRARGWGYQKIADKLNKEGVPTIRGGTKWRVSSVQAAAGYRRPSRHG